MLCGDAARRSRGLRDHIDGCGPGGLGLGASRPTGAEWQLSQYGPYGGLAENHLDSTLSLGNLALGPFSGRQTPNASSPRGFDGSRCPLYHPRTGQEPHLSVLLDSPSGKMESSTL